ncbi:flagellar motor switch protein FliN [Candidatus Liberibacter americanus]|uniref:Flagellar motor switch protein FliN n=1 Tax=Candidatus Liberibacter americanus str. Sao Paulo TaxID=1261131 RepID=U6B4T3_9HYPH|nr:flagellar motor switch protein FliN [Candidatus Liberibacter americanus]AHA27633.1 Flagellar motor switch protein FliN [Candidatus Liberibacter americanus str. Sao Paulo]EMS36342.1 flagellar motor switch protein [Candidatus Liberibacter americanus PW_SP]
MNIDTTYNEDNSFNKEKKIPMDNNILKNDSTNNNNNIFEKSSTNKVNNLEQSNDNIDLIMNIPINFQVILGSCSMQIAELVNLSKGDIIKLDRRIGEHVEININNQKIAKGEITIMDDDTRFGVKIVEIIHSS